MRREIKPEDVPQLVRDGKLEFGMELEFSDDKEFETIGTCKLIFDGLNIETGKFLCHHKKIENTPRLYQFSRFPLPDLRDGDPVWINNNGVWEKAHFKEYTEKCGGIHYYPFHRSNWTNHVEGSYYASDWRTPIRRELEAGYSEDQIAEMMGRWGGK